MFSHIFLYENPKAEGRYICSSHEATIYQLAEMIKEKWPEYNVPTEFKGIDKDVPVLTFSSDKLRSMGFKFKYSLEDMFRGAIETCREMGLLPWSTIGNYDNGEKKHESGEEKHTSEEKKIPASYVNGEVKHANGEEPTGSISNLQFQWPREITEIYTK